MRKANTILYHLCNCYTQCLWTTAIKNFVYRTSVTVLIGRKFLLYNKRIKSHNRGKTVFSPYGKVLGGYINGFFWPTNIFIRLQNGICVPNTSNWIKIGEITVTLIVLNDRLVGTLWLNYVRGISEREDKVSYLALQNWRKIWKNLSFTAFSIIHFYTFVF